MNLLRFREVLSYYCRTAYEVSCLLCYALSICYATARPSSYHGHLAIGTIAMSIVTSAVTLPLMLPIESSTSPLVCFCVLSRQK